MLEEFWRALSIHLGATIHVDLIRGRNRHHVAEATFKALGLALREAMAAGGGSGAPSSKGLLGEDPRKSAPRHRDFPDPMIAIVDYGVGQPALGRARAGARRARR